MPATHFSRFILPSALAMFTFLSVTAARAQLVADGALATINGVSTNLGEANLIVGTNGSNTRLVITNGGAVEDVSGYLGFDSSSSTNQLTVTGANSLWTNSGSINIGNAGSFNTLLITNGGRVENVYASIGDSAEANRNQVIVNGAGSVWNNSAFIAVGYSGSFNSLLATNGGVVYSSGGYLGNNPGSTDNQATVSGANSAWTNSSTLAVGESGSSNTLLIANGGTVASFDGYVGNVLGAANNQAIVSGPNSVWDNSGTLSAGNEGSFNTLLITNGGRVNSFFAYVGSYANASNNQAIVSGANSAWNSGGSLFVGDEGSFNTLVITNGGRVANVDGYVGNSPVAANNRTIVSGNNAAWINSGTLSIGDSGAFNTLVITNSGRVTNTTAYIGKNPGADSNRTIVSGANSVWNNSSSLSVGESGSFNTLLITNGGRVANTEGYIGGVSSASNNQATVSGTNSAWINSGPLFVGYAGSFNILLITNAGTVTAVTNVTVGFDPGSTGNRLTVAGGTLRATNATGDATFDIRRGTNLLNAGLIEVDQLVLTDPQGRFDFNGGTLNVGSAAVANGALFSVGNDSSAATYRMSGVTASSHSFANGLRISGNATFTGNGSVVGTLTVASGGTLSPGASVGKIILSNSPALQGNLFMEISKSGPTLTNDQIHVAGALAYGGSLTVSNLGPGILALGDSFQLFSAGSYSGALTSISPPTLPAGLNWTNKLLLNGSIAVVNKTVLSIGGLTKTGTNLIFNVTGGSPGAAWYLLTTTNVALPLSSWTTNKTGVFDWVGNVTLTNGINFAEPRRFFRIYAP